MLPLTFATFDGLVADTEEVPNFATTTVPFFVCACVSFVVVPVALQALVNLDKALRLYIISGNGCVKHYDPTRYEFMCLFRRRTSDLDDPRLGWSVNIQHSDVIFSRDFRLNRLTRSSQDCQ